MTNAAQDSTLTVLTNSPSLPPFCHRQIIWTEKAKRNNTSSVDSSNQVSSLAIEALSSQESLHAAKPVHSRGLFQVSNNSRSCYLSSQTKSLSSVENHETHKRNARGISRSTYATCHSTIGKSKDRTHDNIEYEVKLPHRSEPDTTSSQSRSQISADVEQKATINVPEFGQSKQIAHFRSFSLNDIASVQNTKCSYTQNQHYYSSSSSDHIANKLNTEPSYPLHPTYPPPNGCLTPPGLPSFGTTEAQELRLIPSSRPEWFEDLLKRLRRHAQIEHTENSADGNIGLFASNSTQERVDAFANPRDQLRHMLGLSRLVTAPSDHKMNRRANLPPGVMVASVPGALARAEDGSMVRGRFGYRASGHGVGPRPIEAHPLNLDSRSNEREQVVGEIGKSSQNNLAGTAYENSIVSAAEACSMTNANIHIADVGQQAGTWESSSTVRALSAERRAIGALERTRKENQRLRMALAAAQYQRAESFSVRGQNNGFSHTRSHLQHPAVFNARNDEPSNSNDSTAPSAGYRMHSLPVRGGLIQRMREPRCYAERSQTASGDRNITQRMDMETHQQEQDARHQVKEKKISKSSCTFFYERTFGACCSWLFAGTSATSHQPVSSSNTP